jgi:hypothetical protein
MEEGNFIDLPPEISRQLESSKFNKRQISSHPEEVLQALSFASQKSAELRDKETNKRKEKK